MIRLGTRGSPLAVTQARFIAERLARLGAEVRIVPMRTEGDRRLEAQLAAIGGKGLFVREIEQALLEDGIDLAVHSLKDLPAEVPPGLCLAAFPTREDPRDVLVSRAGGTLESLPVGAVLGTSSPRRRAIALALRPDVVIRPVRGNVDTRLRKLETGGLDAIILAAAGLNRLGLAPERGQPLDPEVFVPAVGQGILAIETRVGDGSTRALVGRLDDPATRACAIAERAYLRRLGASCATPVAAHATVTADGLRVTALVASEDGRRTLRAEVVGAPTMAESLGRSLADSLLARGAAALVPLMPDAAVAESGRMPGGGR